MPLTLPNLDDRTFEDLVAEALAMLPRHAPAWTNHNPSDPGITLVELLAYFTEIFIYRLNRITRETKIAFLQLLCGADRGQVAAWTAMTNDELDDAFRDALGGLRRTERAVTQEDYGALVLRAMARTPSAEGRVFRTVAFPRQNLESRDTESRDREAPGHVSLVILTSRETPPESVPALMTGLREYLEPRRLLTTRLHVVEPLYLWVRVRAELHMQPDARDAELREAPVNAMAKLGACFSPFPGGGPQGEGWPLGRALYLSEIYEALEQVAGVDYVENVEVISVSASEDAADAGTHIGVSVGRSMVGIDARLGAGPAEGKGRILRDGTGRLAGIALKPYELVRLASGAEDFSVL